MPAARRGQGSLTPHLQTCYLHTSKHVHLRPTSLLFITLRAGRLHPHLVNFAVTSICKRLGQHKQRKGWGDGVKPSPPTQTDEVGVGATTNSRDGGRGWKAANEGHQRTRIGVSSASFDSFAKPDRRAHFWHTLGDTRHNTAAPWSFALGFFKSVPSHGFKQLTWLVCLLKHLFLHVLAEAQANPSSQNAGCARSCLVVSIKCSVLKHRITPERAHT